MAKGAVGFHMLIDLKGKGLFVKKVFGVELEFPEGPEGLIITERCSLAVCGFSGLAMLSRLTHKPFSPIYTLSRAASYHLDFFNSMAAAIMIFESLSMGIAYTVWTLWIKITGIREKHK